MMTTYAYDGERHRVRKDGICYVYDAFGNLAAEYWGPVQAPGRQYVTVDALGSTRLLTDDGGVPVARYDYLPFGGEMMAGTNGRTTAMGYASADDSTPIKFTGKERDLNSDGFPTSFDYFLARYYSPAQGRFTSADEFKGGNVDPFTGLDILKPGPVMYADINDPQTLNKYGYVRNSPLRYVDPNGYLLASADGDGAEPGCHTDFRLCFPHQNSGSSSNGTTITSVTVTSSAPTIVLGGVVGEMIEPAGGGFAGALIGSMFGVGPTVSYVSSTDSWYAGVAATFSPLLLSGTGASGSTVIVPAGLNPNAIANGLSMSVTYQPNPLAGSTVLKSPGSPAVAGPSIGTKVPVALGASYNVNITPAMRSVKSFFRGFVDSLSLSVPWLR